MKPPAVGRAAPLVALLVLAAACSSSNDKAKPDADTAKVASNEPGPTRLHEKPFTAHFDALLNRFLPRGEFAPGVEALWAPIHSGVNATLYFMALRNNIPRYVSQHEETFFIVSGTGSLDLADGKRRNIEGGFVVRIPPGYTHGFTSNKTEPLLAIVVAAPTVNALLAAPSDTDAKDVTGIIYCADVTLPEALRTPPQEKFAIARFLDQTKRSTLQLAAVQRDRIPDHKHLTHDETVIIFFQQGFGFLRQDESVNPTEAVQIAHIPAGTVHSFEHQADGQSRAVSIFTPGYDGKDRVLVEETRELQAPNGYKKTNKDGDWIDKDDKRPEIKLGGNAPPR